MDPIGVPITILEMTNAPISKPYIMIFWIGINSISLVVQLLTSASRASQYDNIFIAPGSEASIANVRELCHQGSNRI